MIRRLFTIASALSLVLLIAVIALWFYLPRRGTMRFYTSSAQYSVSASAKSLVVRVMGGTLHPDGAFRAPPGKHWDGRWANPQPLGFGFGKSPSSDQKAAFYLGIVAPWWALTALIALLPCLWLVLRLHAQRQHDRGIPHCPKCGYDLRASPDRCPECGTSTAGNAD